MDTPQQNPQTLSMKGQEALNAGHTRDAIELFERVRNLIGATAEIEHMLGICYRLEKLVELAHEAFCNALNLAETDLHRAQIWRDYGMLYLVVIGDIDEAIRTFQRSCDILKVLMSNNQESTAGIEYAVSLGFMARVCLVQGRIREALGYFYAANRRLRGHAPYELNNLAWYMAASFFQSWKLVWRMLRLALWPTNKNERNWRRGRQAIYLCIPGIRRAVIRRMHKR